MLSEDVAPYYRHLAEAVTTFSSISVSLFGWVIATNRTKRSAIARPHSDRLRLALEALSVLSQTGLSVSMLLLGVQTQYFAMQVSVWLYLAVLLGLRSRCQLWTHSMGIYLLQLLISIVELRSAVLAKTDERVMLGSFAVTALAVYAAGSARIVGQTIDPSTTASKPSPEPTSSFFSIITVSYMNPFLRLGHERALEFGDIWDLQPEDKTSAVIENFESYKGGFASRLVNQLALKYAGCLLLTTLDSITYFAPTFCLKLILEYMENPENTSSSVAWTCAFSLLLIGQVNISGFAYMVNLGRRASMHAECIINNELYNKALKRQAASLPNSPTTGSILNLMSVDTGKVVLAILNSYELFGFLLQVGIATAMLYWVLGWSAFVLILGCIIVTPINYAFVSAMAKLQAQVMKLSDERVEKTNELMQCIRVVKYFAWERKFADGIYEVREKELKALRKKMLIDSASIGMFLGTPVVIISATFFVYVQSGHTLTSAVAFTAFALFNLLNGPIEAIADIFGDFVEANVSYHRIMAFLNSEETPKHHHLQHNGNIGFENASFEWSAKGFKLREINVRFRANELTVVSGPTGCGKTSLLMALLGEMSLLGGAVSCGSDASDVAFCAQQAWILNDTVKNNILFASAYDEERYKWVIDVCALSQDLAILSNGDETLVGERGVMLSGGQKQRISLARAFYSHAKIILLDDCLSAVDSGTAMHIYDHCLSAAVDRTIILASHNVALTASKADRLIVMENGAVKQDGPPENVTNTAPAVDRANRNNEERLDPKSKEQTEFKETGHVKWAVFKSYFSALGGKWFWVVLLLAFALENYSKMWRAWWLRNWALDSYNQGIGFYIGWYCAIGVLAIVVTCSQAMFLLTNTVKTSRHMFERLLESTLHAEMRVFETKPLGQIMNRFSKDVECIDQEIPGGLEYMLHLAYTSVSIIVLISIVTPKILIVAGFVAVVYTILTVYFMTTARELKRFESTSRSPLYQHFSQTLSGTATIRAYNQTRQFNKQLHDDIDYNHRPFYYMWATTMWLCFRINFTGHFVAFFAAAFVISNAGVIDSGLAGLSLSYAVTFKDAVYAFIKVYAKFEQSMNSVERVNEYINLPKEPSGGKHFEPTHGAIRFDDISLRYAPNLPLVLKNVSFEIQPGEKVGISGRTGSGKSTIINALFRMVSLETGAIYIDGVDTATCELQSIRQSLAIIPQDPALFAGTIRSNLDPFSHSTDDEVHQALDRVCLTGYSLDSPITEMGNNLSQGQRQLVCLARALLTKPKILLLDEATASIDYKTDARIQQTIREHFSTCTLITIAHRLKSIIDYDRILVLEGGQVAEFDTPANLLYNDSKFASMCQTAGELAKMRSLVG